jgi:hypothetical protein
MLRMIIMSLSFVEVVSGFGTQMWKAQQDMYCPEITIAKHEAVEF